MSDDWSLKDKRYKDFEDGMECYDWIQNDENTYYKQEDIETLKQKLIEDFEKESNYNTTNLLLHRVKNIVNKRFGVE